MTKREKLDATRAAADGETKQRYSAPEIKVAGSAVELVQGCGGSSGSDSRYYRIPC
jgi:hypothetical protein